ncbi:hypothetical protein [Desulfoluna sp.]|uniref:hypothetical protein n=1 Tax=Desulfoluna sp. TaxID=2045199 RepID=UPI00261EB9CA|nr:hypothetical protein [Desulfoluna sp.]
MKKNSRADKGLRFLLCVGAVAAVIWGTGPLLNDWSVINPLMTFIEERDIDAGAYYYTDIEEFAEAGLIMDNTMTYCVNR